MTEQIFHARSGMGKKVRGRALVAKDGFSARYDLDRINGIFSRPEHKLVGESYIDRILVLDAAKGGVATAWMLHDMTARGITPPCMRRPRRFRIRILRTLRPICRVRHR